MACQIHIEGISAGPPYPGGLPQAIAVFGRTTADCTSVNLVVRVAGPGSPPLVSTTVPVGVGDSNVGPQGLPGLFVHQLALPSQLGLACGDVLFVEATCSDNPNCRDSGSSSITCKPGSLGSGPGTGPGPGNGSGNGGWPPSRCFWSGVSAAMALLAGLTLLGVGIALMDSVTTTAAVVLFGIAGLAWALWVFWCQPSTCVKLAVLCWVFKRAFIASIPILGFSISALSILVLIGYGAAAGILVDRLQRNRCPVPSALGPITQIPL
jgi:hypothetical protein